MKFWHRWRGFRQYSDSGLHTGNQARDTHGPRTQGILLVMPPLFRTTTCNFTNPAFFYGKFLNPLPFWENFENSTPPPLSLYKGEEGFKLCWMSFCERICSQYRHNFAKTDAFPLNIPNVSFTSDPIGRGKAMSFSSDGNLFAFCNGEK